MKNPLKRVVWRILKSVCCFSERYGLPVKVVVVVIAILDRIWIF